LAQILTQLINNSQVKQNHGGNNGFGGINGHNGNQNRRGNNGAGGSNGNHAKGNNNNIHAHVGTTTTSRVIPRSLMPNFLGEQQTGNQGQQGLGETCND
jgi:hypothetical protein